MVAQTLSLHDRVASLKKLKEILACMPLFEQVEFLSHTAEVGHALQTLPWLRAQSAFLTLEERHALYAFLAIGEGKRCLDAQEPFGGSLGGGEELFQLLRQLLGRLIHLEHLYKGLINYHLLCLEHILHEEAHTPYCTLEGVAYTMPPVMDIRRKTPLIRQAITTALEGMHAMAECYVVGGAAERLQCVDPHTQTPLPAALFSFGGLPGLLTWLMRDLIAREALATAFTGQPVAIPVVLMTSQENHDAVMEFCRRSQWFGRPSEYFFFVQQPLVPLVTEKGEWVTEKPMQLQWRASGHGVLWHQMQEAGLLQSLQTMGVRKVLIRQINNPFSGWDDGILAFVGLGLLRDKAFGFASCERKIGAPEGMNVLRELHVGSQVGYCITNIEYTQFRKQGIEELPVCEGSPYSVFPANTNILFADLAAIEQALQKDPLPGLLLNMKTKVHREPHGHQGHHSHHATLRAGRLESTMQNIADGIMDLFPEKQSNLQWDSLSTYLTYNDRHKTLCVVKNAFQEGADPFGTPPACFYELQVLLRELLVDVCHMEMPSLPSLEEYLRSCPPFWLQLSPRLGPLYSLIKAKIAGGSIEAGSHLVLELANLWMHDLHLQGSLHIEAKGIGSCLLHRVKVCNRGACLNEGTQCWKGDFDVEGMCRIYIEGDGVFIAKDVCLTGNLCVHVRAGSCVTAYYGSGGRLCFRTEKLSGLSGHPWRAALMVTEEGEVTCVPPT